MNRSHVSLSTLAVLGVAALAASGAGATTLIHPAAPTQESEPSLHDLTDPNFFEGGAPAPQVGDQLVANPGIWSPDPGSSTVDFDYSWMDCNATGQDCTPVAKSPGATSDQYTVAASDVGHTIKVVFTPFDAPSGPQGAPVTISPFLPTVAAAKAVVPKLTAAPKISGTATVGKTLVTSDGTWENAPASYGFQWEKCTSAKAASCTSLGASGRKAKLVLTNALKGDRVRVVVTAKGSGGAATGDSKLVGPVK